MKRKNGLIIALTAISLASVAVGATATLAGFTAADNLTTTAGYSGNLPKNIYFNANYWNTAGAEFFIYAWDNAGTPNHTWLRPIKTITPTINATSFTLYMFRVDTTTYNGGYIFVRMNPEHSADPSFEHAWNQTCDVAYNYAPNYFCISQWHYQDNDAYPSVLQTNTLSVSNGNLTFTGSDQYISGTA